ncbi:MULTISPECIES: MFS transporter [Streptomyces]|uniref:MFS transporter n=2 Tax=Streptomyces TaxID=1883 RepID=UPI00287F7759|nr:MFS transporter [Streptomyces sp. CGMCC 4.1456]WNF63768.1 MFS transporter [Streptomyces sp. CGMCC 4.1456]
MQRVPMPCAFVELLLPGDRRPFTAVLASNVISITGSVFTGMGVPWLVLQSTGSAAKAGIVAFCSVLPVVLSAIVGGPVIDFIGRLRVGLVSDLVCGVAVAAIALLEFAGVLQFWMLCALMAVTGLFHAPGETARGVLLPTLAERAGMPLTRAAGWYDGASRCAGMIGSAVGGVLIALLGAQHVLLLDAATFALSAALLAFGLRDLPEARPQKRPEPASVRSYRRELGEGYRFVLGTPLLLGICLMTLATKGFDQSWSAVLLPVHAREELGGAADLGLLNATFSVCALAGALAYGAVGSRFRRRPVFTIAFLIGGMPRFVVAACSDTVAPLAVTMAVEGVAFGIINPILTTVMYEIVPERLRSRVLSATTASVLTITPLGGLTAGYLVDSTGLFTTMLVIGGAYLLATLAPTIFPSWRRMDHLAPSAGESKSPIPHDAESPSAVPRRPATDNSCADPDAPERGT